MDCSEVRAECVLTMKYSEAESGKVEGCLFCFAQVSDPQENRNRIAQTL
jgi:hypothetical protein